MTEEAFIMTSAIPGKWATMITALGPEEMR
jgi:hypothetical protein